VGGWVGVSVCVCVCVSGKPAPRDCLRVPSRFGDEIGIYIYR